MGGSSPKAGDPTVVHRDDLASGMPVKTQKQGDGPAVFQVTSPAVNEIHVLVRDHTGHDPVAGKKYTITGHGQSFSGTTGANGEIDQPTTSDGKALEAGVYDLKIPDVTADTLHVDARDAKEGSQTVRVAGWPKKKDDDPAVDRPDPPVHPPIKKGEESALARHLQTLLNAASSKSVTVTAIFDAATVALLKSYQKAQGLTEYKGDDPFQDDATWAALEKDPGPYGTIHICEIGVYEASDAKKKEVAAATKKEGDDLDQQGKDLDAEATTLQSEQDAIDKDQQAVDAETDPAAKAKKAEALAARKKDHDAKQKKHDKKKAEHDLDVKRLPFKKQPDRFYAGQSNGIPYEGLLWLHLMDEVKYDTISGLAGKSGKPVIFTTKLSVDTDGTTKAEAAQYKKDRIAREEQELKDQDAEIKQLTADIKTQEQALAQDSAAIKAETDPATKAQMTQAHAAQQADLDAKKKDLAQKKQAHAQLKAKHDKYKGRAWDPDLQEETSYRWDDGKNPNASLSAVDIPYFVVSGGIGDAGGISFGDVAAIIYKKKVIFAIWGDSSGGRPAVWNYKRTGEAAVRTHILLGAPEQEIIDYPNQVNVPWSDTSVVTHIVFPGSSFGAKLPVDPAGASATVDKIQARGKALLKLAGGDADKST